MGVAVRLLKQEMELALGAEICLGCGGAKRPRAFFCDDCFHALPLYLRSWIQRVADRVPEPAFAEAFRAALQHIVDVRPLRARPWEFSDLDELERAGFRFLDYGQCGSIRCLRQIVWVRTPAGRRLALDAETVRPHGISCLDPVGTALRRIRALQTPAGRRRRKGAA